MPEPNNQEAAAVECRGLEKTYGEGPSSVFALRGVDLVMRRGEFLMIVGPSGCGKTTLISLITGMLDPSAGSCHVYGSDLQRLSESDRTRLRGKKVGFIFQQFNLLPTLSLRQNVAVPLLLGGVPYASAVRQADICLERVGLGDRTHSLPRDLSGGQQQRVAIARAIVHTPTLLVCDEPTSALDHRTGQNIMGLMKEICLSQGCGVIVVTHDSRIFHYADRIAEMDDGRIVGYREPEPSESHVRSTH
jgi:putative ABC transport system ATP-binding protein